jgi:ribosomal protein S18 acetylase RimI-like enzyme
MNAAQSLQLAMRTALIARATLTTLLGGAHIFDEVPRGANPSHIQFTAIETRDWSVADQKAHEHFITLEINTNARGRGLAQSLAHEVEAALDSAALSMIDHTLINLRITSTSVARNSKTENFGATLRFRAVTEPNS